MIRADLPAQCAWCSSEATGTYRMPNGQIARTCDRHHLLLESKNGSTD